MNDEPESSATGGLTPVSLLRRLAAMAYDLVAVVALLFFSTLPIVIVQKGQAIAAGNPIYFFYLMFCAYLYFAVSWTRGGQTLGMRAWKIKVVKLSPDAGTVKAADALKRYLFACLSWLCFGIGFLAALVDKDKLAWHDRWSKTRLIFDS